MAEFDNNVNDSELSEEAQVCDRDETVCDEAVNKCDGEDSDVAEGELSGKAQGGKKKSFFSSKQASSESKKLAEENEMLKKSNEELKEHYMRMAAEYENYKRRTAKEMETRYTDAKADTIKKLLPIVDSYERALNIPVPAECEEYDKGIKMIYEKLLETLTAMGVEEIKAVGETFDPNLHYAVMHIDDETLGENVVAEVFEKGYRIGDKVLRYSMVKVAN